MAANPGLAAIVGCVLLVGCAAQQYRAAPLSADAAAAAFEARSLADPGLRAFEERCLGHAIEQWPPAEWDLRTLSLAGYYFNPEIEAARARSAEAKAAAETAAARPNPSFEIVPGIPSPYLLTLDLSVPVQTAGKRGHRIQAARSLDRAARLDLAESAWRIRSALRAALVDYLAASRALDLLHAEARIRERQLEVLQRASSAGEIARPAVLAARAELSQTRAALGAAEEAVAVARAALAAAIGIPAAALAERRIVWPDMDRPPDTGTLELAGIRRDAVLNRLDVRGALARYAAAEADLQLEIAKQYPDFNLGPGYSYEERQSYFTVGLSASIPLFDRNRGPIAEAEARRRKAAAAFVATQADAILQSERTLAVYRVALAGLAEAQHFADLQADQHEDVLRAVRAGERDGLDLDEIEIQGVVAARARLEALAHAQRALGELEDAVERPLIPGDELPAADALDPAG
jgi:outer membrane protein TolC